jgi:periplasmic protein TonB
LPRSLLSGCGLSLVLHGIGVAAVSRPPGRLDAATLDEISVAVSLIESETAADTTPGAAADPEPAPPAPVRLPRAKPRPRLAKAPAALVHAVVEAAGKPADARPPDPGPALLTAGQAHGLRVYDEFPDLPQPMRIPGAHHDVQATVCVSERGAVSAVKFDTLGLPLLERVLDAAIRTWRYRPWQTNGTARAFCHAIVFAYRVG